MYLPWVLIKCLDDKQIFNSSVVFLYVIYSTGIQRQTHKISLASQLTVYQHNGGGNKETHNHAREASMGSS